MADPTGAGNPSERIIQTDLRNEMSRSYLEYAMSVIVGRACSMPAMPSFVHRRIFMMYELGLTAEAYRKCARVVGEVLGNTTPTGTPPSTTRWCEWPRTSRCGLPHRWSWQLWLGG